MITLWANPPTPVVYDQHIGRCQRVVDVQALRPSVPEKLPYFALLPVGHSPGWSGNIPLAYVFRGPMRFVLRPVRSLPRSPVMRCAAIERYTELLDQFIPLLLLPLSDGLTDGLPNRILI